MKVGDLVKIQKWCKNKGRLASVVEVPWYDDTWVFIQYMDPNGLAERPCKALIHNLVLLSENG